jgi:uncharacterized protein (DUF305 family)
MGSIIRNMTSRRSGKRYALGEIGHEEYERFRDTLRNGRVEAESGGARSKLLVAGLVAAVLLTAAAGVAFARYQAGSMMGRDGMESMMGNDAMDSMSGGGMMGSFDEDRPFDLQFIDQMIMHHEGAIVSSKYMISDSTRPELRKLAESIQRSQSEQVEQMQEWRKRWYPDAERTFGMMDDGAMERMMGGSMREMMIPHHQLAVDMSEKALTEAEHPELKALAQKIKDEQSAEIEPMKGYLDEIEKTDGT